MPMPAKAGGGNEGEGGRAVVRGCIGAPRRLVIGQAGGSGPIDQGTLVLAGLTRCYIVFVHLLKTMAAIKKLCP